MEHATGYVVEALSHAYRDEVVKMSSGKAADG
jgi:hypothetical protein